MNGFPQRLFSLLAVGLLLLSGACALQAEPALNWAPADNRISNEALISCNRPGFSSNNCNTDFEVHLPGIEHNEIDRDRTPFLQEMVSDEAGNRYYHLIIGLPTDAFAQEAYIRAQPSSECGGQWSSGKMECSASGGARGNINASWDDTQLVATTNGWDPLSSNAAVTGNGTGDPTRMIARQIIKAPDMTQEFLKDKYAFKPKISQNISADEVTAQFVLDMSNSDYLASTTADNATPGTIINKVTFTDPAVPGNFDATASTADFKTAKAAATHITGGLFTYDTGNGGEANPFSFGTYTYAENGGANSNDLDWNAFRNPEENRILSGVLGGGEVEVRHQNEGELDPAPQTLEALAGEPVFEARLRAGAICKDHSKPAGC